MRASAIPQSIRRMATTGIAWAMLEAGTGASAFAQGQTPYNPFQPFSHEWPTPSERRLSSGAPGPAYWQQRADYDMDITLDDARQRIAGKATISYHNLSPHNLTYLWVQLDQNEQNPHSLARQMESAEPYQDASKAAQGLAAMRPTFKGGLEVSSVTDADGAPLQHTIVETNMRIDLPRQLKPGETFRFKAEWAYNINNARTEGRSGYEYFPSDGQYVYQIAQFFPRLCAYDDIDGWQNAPYLGPSEFSLEFGDYTVRIDVPEDHIVAATGELSNAEEVLTKKQLMRLNAIKSQEGVVDFIVSPKEAGAIAAVPAAGRKTWTFKAESVRDFAFASSRRFIWDAAAITIGGRKVIAQSLYPKEGMPLWDKYATHAVIHTLRTYSQLTFDYPYSAATAVHGPVWGMEYPMVAFCGGRPLPTGFYSRQAKYLMIGVIIHEVGHNFFPMVVNNDERRWAWMDEGINSFCQYIAEDTWEPDFPYRRGPADAYAPYMKQPGQQPIMTNPDAIRDNGKISYEKVAVGLGILRNQVMGKVHFDRAFHEYASRWAFKRPEPADFFRSLEDISGRQLAWFWREWFYGTGHIDHAIAHVSHFKLPPSAAPQGHIDPHLLPQQPSTPRQYYIDDKPELQDKYTGMKQQDEAYAHDSQLIDELLKAFRRDPEDYHHLYQVRIKNKGNCIMPFTLQVTYSDGSQESFALPVEIWMLGAQEFTKNIHSSKEAVAFHLDPQHAIPDTDRDNNVFPHPALGLKIVSHDHRP